MLNITKNCGKDKCKSHGLHSTKKYFSFFITRQLKRFVKIKFSKKSLQNRRDWHHCIIMHMSLPWHSYSPISSARREQRGVLLTCGSLWHSRCYSPRPQWKALRLDPLCTPHSGNSRDGRTCQVPGGSGRPQTHTKKTQDNNSEGWEGGHGGHSVKYKELHSGGGSLST